MYRIDGSEKYTSEYEYNNIKAWKFVNKIHSKRQGIITDLVQWPINWSE